MDENIFNLAVIPGDGIGGEVTAAALEVLRKASSGTGIGFVTREYGLGGQRYRSTGEILDDATLADIKTADAILLGAIGDPEVPSGLLERELLLKLRFELDHYVNLRPARLYRTEDSPLENPGEIDFVVVREGTEGPYTGNGGAMRIGTDAEVATEVSLNTAFGVRRVVEYAFEQAQNRLRTRDVPKKVTLVHKHNVLINAGHLWRRIVEDVARKYPDVTVDYLHVDAATMFIVTDPGRFDVIVTDSLFGDIITDLAAAVTGGIGLAASANINPELKAPSMFEPVHGSAPDLAGRGIADPTAAILSVALLCDFLSGQNPPLREISQKIRVAVEQDLMSEGRRNRSTETVIASILNYVSLRGSLVGSGDPG